MMARRFMVNCLQQLGQTGVTGISTSNTFTTSGVSQELYGFSTADTARFYGDISSISGSVTFDLWERDPATGVFVKVSPASDLLFGVAHSAVAAGMVSTVQVVGECYQLSWTVTGTVTCSVVASLTISG